MKRTKSKKQEGKNKQKEKKKEGEYCRKGDEAKNKQSISGKEKNEAERWKPRVKKTERDKGSKEGKRSL